MANYSACETGPFPALTWLIHAASLIGVSQSANFTARRHVDLRRHAGALCLFRHRGC
ncbi:MULTISPECIES: putative leader peptide [unclassified Streptomyces]|uniref:putative leader peptide n=1 Tax=unclassified Streptomyces TaxID=2593676 RepID=UPI0033AB9E31